MPGTRSGAFIPQVHQVSDDSDGVHKCDHTRGVEKKQLDDGIDHSFVSAGGSETICQSFLFKLCPACHVVVDPSLENQYQSTMDMHLRGAHPSLGLDVGEPPPRR
jgi:hypothetical protein